ncbi:MAG: CdaR family protein [Bacillota bacterium]|nr:CdaR family protein [Bacillota bacterium]
MNELLKKDLTIKIISIIFAVVMWYNVVDRNSNPIDTTSISVPLEVMSKNSLADKKIGLKDNAFPNILLTTKGRRDRLNSMRRDDFKATIDLSEIKSITENELPIKVIGNDAEISIESIEPRTIKLDLEKITQNSFKVDVNMKGIIKNNYHVINQTIIPDTIPIEGYDSIIKSISSVKADVDITDLDKNLTIEKECRFYNDKNEDISNQLNKSVKVKIKLDVAKEVKIIPDVRGIPAREYINSDFKAVPDRINVVGPPDILSDLDEIKAQPVNINNLTSSINLKSSLILPKGISVVNSANDVSIHVMIEKEARKDFTISSDDITVIYPNISVPLKYSIVTQNITISVKGKKSDLENININNLKPSINVAGLANTPVGSYKLPLNLSLPVNIRPGDNYEIEVKVDEI